mmetsp:Transcript_14495/g.27275  ORF Transcript_14495/g.27275 Transcript_14495/m.27275 type:complete len:295 (+) Transcript_14495:78-962(+)
MNSTVRILTQSCLDGHLFEMKNTIRTCFSNSSHLVFLDSLDPQAGANMDFALICGSYCPLYTLKAGACAVDQCSKHHPGGGFTFDGNLRPKPKSRRQIVLGQLPGLWGLHNTLGDISQLCKLSNQLRRQYNIEIAPPCFELPADINKILTDLPVLKVKHPYWIFKPAMSTSGKGIHFVTSAEIASAAYSFPNGTVQGYMQNPFLYDRSFNPDGAKNIKIKLDLRIYGVQTAAQPMRIFVSKFGYFRTGHPDVPFSMDIDFSENAFVHATNNGGKIRTGIFRKGDTQVLDPSISQ